MKPLIKVEFKKNPKDRLADGSITKCLGAYKVIEWAKKQQQKDRQAI
jgi:hypothetical protein